MTLQKEVYKSDVRTMFEVPITFSIPSKSTDNVIFNTQIITNVNMQSTEDMVSLNATVNSKDNLSKANVNNSSYIIAPTTPFDVKNYQ